MAESDNHIFTGAGIPWLRKQIDKLYAKIADVYKKSEVYSKTEADEKYALKTDMLKTASPTVAGIMKLYNALGPQTDGAPQNAVVQAAILANRAPIGAMMWWWGTTDNVPSGWVIMNGSTLPSATYPELYAIIGTAYGGDATNFALPNLTADRRFVRADTVAGVEEEDAIRNITGDVRFAPTTGLISEEYGGEATGAFTKGEEISRCHNSTGGKTYALGFDASLGMGEEGHTDTNIHPANLSAIPILRVA